MNKLDDFLFEQADNYLKFLLEWLGVTKRQACLFHLFVYAVSCVTACFMMKDYLMMGVSLFLSSSVLVQISIGLYWKKSDCFNIYLTLSILVMVLCALATPPRHMDDYLLTVGSFNWIILTYILPSNHDGERGKKAKLAWSKIKELFGTDWIAQPLKGF